MAVEIVTPLLILAIWALMSANSTSLYFPPLTTILSELFTIWTGPAFVEHAVPSLLRMVTGFAIGSIVAAIAGLILGVVPVVRRIVWPVSEFLRSMPSVALIPLGIAILGVGDGMKVGIIALGCFFPVLLSTLDGVRSVEPMLLDVAESLKFSRWEKLFRVVLPASSPQIYAGVRVSLALALILMVVSELLASTNGIGYSLLRAQRLFELPEVWADTVLLGVLGYLINLILVTTEKYVLAWHRGFKDAALSQ